MLRPPPIAALALTLCAGCHTLDISQPIALVPDSSFGDADRRILHAAAGCWNDEFGTDLRVSRPGEDVTTGVLQQVRVGYLEFVCAFAAGRTETTLPVRISVCPPRYHLVGGSWTVWNLGSYLDGALFIIVTHEIGHALNILPHAEGGRAVMSAGGSLFPYDWAKSFHVEDRQLLLEGNPGFVPRSRCPSGKVRIVAGDDSPHCACW